MGSLNAYNDQLRQYQNMLNQHLNTLPLQGYSFSNDQFEAVKKEEPKQEPLLLLLEDVQ